MASVLDALSLLTPYDIDSRKVRIGPKTDGGYIFMNNITPEQIIISYGISFEYRFDSEMARRGHKVYMFDHTIDGINATSPNMLWFKEGVGATNADNSLFSIDDHLRRHAIEGSRMILKMDVEGYEFEAFEHITEHTLGRFEQIVLEVHGLSMLEDDTYRARFVEVFTKINRQFTLFHVHANNCDGANGITMVQGLPVSNLLELSYVNSSSVSRSPNKTLYPTALDYPNVPGKDKLLWFYPFIPTTVSLQDFALCDQRVDYAERMRAAGLEL
jgi:hypothetical protein